MIKIILLLLLIAIGAYSNYHRVCYLLSHYSKFREYLNIEVNYVLAQLILIYEFVVQIGFIGFAIYFLLLYSKTLFK